MILKSFAVLFFFSRFGAECGPLEELPAEWYQTDGIKQSSWETEDKPFVVVSPTGGPSGKPSEPKWYTPSKTPPREGERVETPVRTVSEGGILIVPKGKQSLPMGVYIGNTFIFGTAILNGTQSGLAKDDSVKPREGSEFIYNDAVRGWLKYHNKASWPIALMTCQAEGAVLASPVNSQIRNAIQRFVFREYQSESTIHAGVQARAGTNDYYSVEGVNLKNMPVNIEIGSIGKSSNCVKWITSQGNVMFNNCQDELPFVCLRREEKGQATAGCGPTDTEYKYDDRSGSCYKMHTSSVTWRDAYKVCKKEGGHLAIANNEVETKILMEIYNNHPNSEITNSRWECVLLGMYKSASDGLWWTTQGQELAESGFPGWAPSQPNNVGENCACMYRIGAYHDISCDIALAYICEKKAEILYT